MLGKVVTHSVTMVRINPPGAIARTINACTHARVVCVGLC